MDTAQANAEPAEDYQCHNNRVTGMLGRNSEKSVGAEVRMGATVYPHNATCHAQPCLHPCVVDLSQTL